MKSLNTLFLLVFLTISASLPVFSQSPGGFYWIVTYNYNGGCFQGAPVTITANAAGCAEDANSVLSGSTVSYDFSDCSTDGSAWYWTTAVGCADSTCNVQNCPTMQLTLSGNPNNTLVCVTNSSTLSTAILCTPTSELPTFPTGYLLSSVYSTGTCQAPPFSTQVTSQILGQCEIAQGGQVSSIVTCHGAGLSQTNYYGTDCQTVSQKSVTDKPVCQSTGSGGLLTGCTTHGPPPPPSNATLPLLSAWSLLVASVVSILGFMQ